MSETVLVTNTGMNRRIQLAIKRAFDIIVSFTALILFSPLIALIALAIWLTMGPPILFRQLRPGYRGRPFVMYKFRTMTDARDAEGNLLPDLTVWKTLKRKGISHPGQATREKFGERLT